MSNTTTVAAAALAAGLAVASVPPAEAGNGLSRKESKQVQKIVQQEVARVLRAQGIGPAGPTGPQGPAGPPGPAGTDGVVPEMRFAHIFSNGAVDTVRSRGISQENIVTSEIADFEDPDTFYGQFCIVGLPPPVGGQVSSDLDTEGLDARDKQLDLTGDGGCIVVEGPPFDGDRGFHVVLFY